MAEIDAVLNLDGMMLMPIVLLDRFDGLAMDVAYRSKHVFSVYFCV